MSQDLYEMSDEELEAAFKEAKQELANEDFDDYEEDQVTDQEVEEETDDFEDSESDDEEVEEDEADDELEEGEEDEQEEEAEEEDKETDPADSDNLSAEPTDEGKSVVRKFKANGKEYEITEAEMYDQFPRIFGQAMDYTRKMQTIQPWRKTIDAIEQAGLKHADINLAIDILKGDKNAIAEVIKRNNLDTLDIDTDESNYVPNDYGRDGKVIAIEEVVETIRNDTEYAKTHEILTKGWDDRSWQALSSDPEKIRLLHIDVKSGLYDKLQPQAEKFKVFDGGRQSDLDYYMMAAREYFSQGSQMQQNTREQELNERERALNARAKVEDVKARQSKREATKQAAGKRKAAAPSARTTQRSGVVDYLNDSDEAFEEWYKRLEERM